MLIAESQEEEIDDFAWSPDSQWLIGADIAGKDLLIARADGTGEPRRIPLSSGNSVSGPRLPVAWQPVWP